MRATAVVFLLCSAAACGDDSSTVDASLVADLSVVPDLTVTGCAPRSVPGFAPTFRPPTGAHQSKCTGSQVSSGVAAVLGGGATYATWASANAGCAACIITDSNAAMLGPLVFISTLGITDGNRDGCVALLTGDSSATSCGAKVQAQFDCSIASCHPGCPITDAASLGAFNTCSVQSFAAAAPCGSYVAPSNTCVMTAAGTTAGAAIGGCFLGSQGVSQWFTDLATFFCGA